MARSSGTRVGKGKGHGGPANGMGWGGPPKGTCAPVNKPFEPGNKAAVGRSNPGEGAAAYRRMRKEERIEKLREMLYGLAEEAEAEAVKFNAIRHLWDREEGAIAPAKPEADTSGGIVVKGGLPDGD